MAEQISAFRNSYKSAERVLRNLYIVARSNLPAFPVRIATPAGGGIDLRQQMWKRLSMAEQQTRASYRKPVVIVSRGSQEKKEIDELVERWMSGEPMDRFGGAYDEDRIQVIHVYAVAPGEV